MAKSYQISNNVIFSVNDDGSVSKFATINENGILQYANGSEAKGATNLWAYWTFSILLLIGAIVFAVLYFNVNEEYERQKYRNDLYLGKNSELNNKVNSLQKENERLKTEKREAESELSSFKSTLVNNGYPMIISNIEIANTYYNRDIETGFGNTLYSYRLMYLSPRINYIGLSSGIRNFKIKWYNQNNVLIRGTSSPSDCTFTESVDICSGNNSFTFKGWGTESKGTFWKSGVQRVEIWYDNVCLGSKKVTIYS